MTGLVQFEAVEYHVLERELYATVTLLRTGDLSGPAEAYYATQSGTAIAGADFVDTKGTATFGSRVGKITVTIPIIDDTLSEPTERFTVSIVGVDSGSSVLFPRTTTVSIEDDENVIPTPQSDPLISAYSVSASVVASGFRYPVNLVYLPHSHGAFVIEKAGIIKFADLSDPAAKPATLLDLRDRVNSKGDRGLTGIVLHPDLAHHPYLYAYYVVDPPDAATATGNAARDAAGNRYCYLSRFTLDLSGPTPKIIKDSEVVLLGGAAHSLADLSGGGALDFSLDKYASLPASNQNTDGSFKRDFIRDDSLTHFGGALAFGPDGMLYVSTGDGSGYDYADPRALNVQSLDSLDGKILRIDPLTGIGLPDNPFADGDLGSNRSKVWALGFRNPYTMVFVPDGRLFASETGWNSWEEINIVTRGANYGWPFYEGGDHGVLLKTTDYKDMPLAQAFYAHVASGAVQITAAYRAFSHVDADPGYQVQAIVGTSQLYAGDDFPPELRDAYFFTDVVDGEVYSADLNDPSKVQYITDIGAYGPTAFVGGPDGMILVDMLNGRLLRLNIAVANFPHKSYGAAK